MASSLRHIVARVEAMRRGPDDTMPDEARLVVEPGMSRYQRKSAKLRERAAAVDITADDPTIDLTQD